MSSKSLVFSSRFSDVVLRWQTIPFYDPSELQILHRLFFSRATALALADMQDDIMLNHWLMVAENSNGRFKSPRGAAFSHYYEALKSDPDLLAG